MSTGWCASTQTPDLEVPRSMLRIAPARRNRREWSMRKTITALTFASIAVRMQGRTIEERTRRVSPVTARTADQKRRYALARRATGAVHADPALHVSRKLRAFEPMNEMAKALTDDDLRVSPISSPSYRSPRRRRCRRPARLQRGQALVQQHHFDTCHNLQLSSIEGVPHIAGERDDLVAKTLGQVQGDNRHGSDGSVADIIGPNFSASEQITDHPCSRRPRKVQLGSDLAPLAGREVGA